MACRFVEQGVPIEQLRTLGLKPGSVVIVHTAFSRVAPVEGGPTGLIAALRAVLGPAGTLVMPSMSDDDDHPFDPGATPVPGDGRRGGHVLEDAGRASQQQPHAFAAAGPRAAEITAPHPVDVPHGLDGPVGRVYELDGNVLLLGAGQDDEYHHSPGGESRRCAIPPGSACDRARGWPLNTRPQDAPPSSGARS